MQEKNLFEYAVIRIVPKVEREEFINVGVVLYCAGKKFLEAKYFLDQPKILSFCSSCDIDVAEKYLQAFVKICAADVDAGPIAQLPFASRFRWLTATRSTVIQTSKVHPGLCANPKEMLEKLFLELVG